MKNKIVISIILILGVLMLQSCSKSNETHRLKIDLQSNFVNEPVKIYLNDRLVFDATINSNPVLGLAATYDGKLPNKSYKIKIVVQNRYESTFNINLNKDQFIGITYYPGTHKIVHQIYDTPFFYE